MLEPVTGTPSAPRENEPGVSTGTTVPSSRAGHHARSAGNLAHSVKVAELCLQIASNFESLVDVQILLAASLLHDVGKLEGAREGAIETWMSDQGRLVGHKIITCADVHEALSTLRLTRPRQALAIMNCLAGVEFATAHLRGYASLKANILAKADQISACADVYRWSLKQSGPRHYYGKRAPHLRETPIHPTVLAVKRQEVLS